MFITGIFAFVVASLLCGPAPGTCPLVLFRAAAAMFPQVLAMMHVPLPEEKRAVVFGAFGVMTGLAGIAGPRLDGDLVDANVFASSQADHKPASRRDHLRADRGQGVLGQGPFRCGTGL